MSTERDVAWGIQRQKSAQTGASLAGCVGCLGTCIVLGLLVTAMGVATGPGVVIVAILAIIGGAWCSNRVFTSTMNR